MKLGRQGDSDSQEQPRKEIIKRDKLERQGGSGSQEKRREIVKGDKGEAAAKSSPEGKSERETSLRGSGSQEQRREIVKGDKVGRQGGSGGQEQLEKKP